MIANLERQFELTAAIKVAARHFLLVRSRWRNSLALQKHAIKLRTYGLRSPRVAIGCVVSLRVRWAAGVIS